MAISFDNVKGWLINGVDGEERDVQWVVRKLDGKLLWGKPIEYVANTTTTLLMPAGKYRIVLIGAGGGGAWSDYGPGDIQYQHATGGGGGGVKGLLTLNETTEVTIVVGLAGKSNGPADYHHNGHYVGFAGGETSISINGENVATAYGGGGADCWDRTHSYCIPGSGGEFKINSDYISDADDSANGNKGSGAKRDYTKPPPDVAYAPGPFAEYEYGYSGGNEQYNGSAWVEKSRASDGAAFITTW